MTGRLATVLALCAAACAPAWKAAPHDRVFQRVEAPVLHRMPRVDYPSDWWDLALHSTVVPLAKTVSPARLLDWMTGGRRALDVNAFGQVPDSTWFENRIGRRAMSLDEIRRGPNRSDGPADGPLLVINGKTEGVSPGFVARDSAGVVWFVKFDPPAYPELATSAELISSRMLYAAGYRVPETFVLSIDLSRLELAPDAKTRDRYDRAVPLTADELGVLLLQLNPSPDGKLRALFSRAVPGRPLGPFSYRGVRSDDPNDRIPHERRRSLRGLWLFQAWLNNTDTRRQNTLDTFVTDDGELGHVEHYLIDFGDALGSAGDREKYLAEGYEHRIDWGEMGKRWISLGLSYPYWLGVRRSPYRSVGIFEAKVFDPERWSPVVPNAAFDEAGAHDTFWAAAILARISPDAVRAVVELAGYTEPGAAEYVIDVLLQRRERLLRYAFGRMLALDDPAMRGHYELELTDLEALNGWLDGSARYTWTVRWNHTGGRDRRLDGGTSDEPRFDLRAAVTRAMTDYRDGFREDPYMTLSIGRTGSDARVRVHLRAVRDRVVPVAIERDVE